MDIDDGMSLGTGTPLPVAGKMTTQPTTQKMFAAKDAPRKIGMRLVHPLATAGAEKNPHRYHPRPFLALSIMPLAP
ncbi:MAG: hypothetical protein LKKZDAJK_000072 [Candidatus Fervidibacter sp.]